MRTKRAVVVLHLFALLVVAGCGGNEGAPAATSQPPPATPTTVGIDEVPDEITVEYVQRVMDAIDRSTGEMFRRLREQGEVTDETRAWVRELHADELVEQSLAWLQYYVDTGFDGVRDVPGDPVTTVEQLLHAAPDCIFLRAASDQSDWFDGELEQSPPAYVHLVPRAGEFRTSTNATAWIVADDFLLLEEEEVAVPCGG